MGYSTPMLEQYNKYNSTHNVSVSDKTFFKWFKEEELTPSLLSTDRYITN